MIKPEFTKNILVLMSGTTIAQAIPIAISPILTRIYTPEDFGVLAIFVSIVTILSIIVTGTYDMAIILPKKDSDALYVILLSCIITFFISLLSLIIVFMFNEQIASFLGDESIRIWLYFVPVSIFLTGIFQNMNYWLNRHKYYKSISKSRIVQSGVTSSTQLLMGLAGQLSSGLILGRVFGQLVSTAIIVKSFLSKRKKILLKRKKVKMIALAKRYKKFPLYESWANLLNTSSTEVPVILISSLFSVGITGFYILANRMLLLPMTLIGSSIGQVFFQEASKIKSNTDELRSLTFSIYKKLVMIGTFPISVVIIYGDVIFAFVFGEAWKVSGEFAQVLGVWILFVFISSPLSNILIVLEKQKESLIFNLVIFLSRISSIIIGFVFFEDVYYTILLFGVTGAVFWLFWYSYILNLANIRFSIALLELLKYFIPSICILTLAKVLLF
jgi:O-antigen/teichoic acid export membrane protein